MSMNQFLTERVFLPLSHFRRARKSDMRDVFHHYTSGTQFRRDARNWNDDRKRDWVLRALRRIVRKAAGETEYYRDLFKQIGFDASEDFGFEDFRSLPILERGDIARARDRMMSSEIPIEKLKKEASGGSTGAPTEFWLGPEERGWMESGIQFSFKKVGVPPGARKAHLWGHHLDPKESDSWSDRVRSYVTNERFFDCFRPNIELFSRYHREFESFSPDCIVAYASALGHFAQYLKENDIRPRNYPRTCFVTGAEKLYDSHREVIKEVFGEGKPVHERYGGRDFGGVAIQTDPRRRGSFEVDWAWALVEPEDENETSSILVTKLHADGMPMIRYRVGDVGKFPRGSRPGEPAFALHEVVGRDLDRIWRPDGTWIHPAEVPHLLKGFPVREFMLLQSEDYNIDLNIVPREGFNDSHNQEILRVIQANMQDVSVRLQLVESIPRTRANKWRPVVSNVQR